MSVQPIKRFPTAIVVVILAIVVIGAAIYASSFSATTPTGATTSFSSNAEKALTTATSTVASDGLQLSLSTNATSLKVGQNLNVELSVANTLPTTNTVRTSDGWQFQGIPVALWPTCYFPTPAEAVVIQGNYSAQELQAVASATFTITCAEAVTFDHLIFQPHSDQANATGVYDVTDTNGTYGPYQLQYSFTTSGYWNLGNLSTEINPPILNGGRPPTAVPFVPGVYTVAVEDEWRQVVALQFSVLPSSS